jgi:hypothetical protein
VDQYLEQVGVQRVVPTWIPLSTSGIFFPEESDVANPDQRP